MTSIVSVQFQRDNRPGEYYGTERNYRTELDLSVGDMVLVPTDGKDVVAKVRSIKELKTIENIYVSEEMSVANDTRYTRTNF